MLDSVCIHQLEQAGPDPDATLYANNYSEESDLGVFALMGNIEKEFSMAQALTVCHDDERIHGLRLTLKMHRFKYKDEQKLIKKFKIQDKYDQIDQMV